MLMQRVLTAIILLACLILLSVFSSPFVFAVLTAILTLLGALEWTRFIGARAYWVRIMYLLGIAILLAGASIFLSVTPTAESLDTSRVVTMMFLACIFWVMALNLMIGYPANSHSWNKQTYIALMGVFVLIPTWCGIVKLKYIDSTGVLFLMLVATVSIADIGAYFIGRTWGQSRLAPMLSPGKSWAGFWGGILSSVSFIAVAVLLANGRMVELDMLGAMLVIIGAVLISVSSVAGDLFESMLKRNRQLKDSGNILPGHGGILDRIDSLTAATPIAVLWMTLLIEVG
jgi:phosphatidate cytidylyltransferase